VVESEGMTLGEWCREVLLERIDGRKPSVIEETLLAEVLALRTILLNAFYKRGPGGEADGRRVAVIHRAGRRRESEEGSRAARGGKNEPGTKNSGVREGRL
jgi:hypothetical protein